jgi:DNA-binding response OmpR family regulator
LAILIVDDDTELTDVLAYMLRRAGHEVSVAHDGEMALQSVQKNVPSLILLDLDLPGKTGWDVCSEVRNDANTPVIILSGASGDDNIVRGLDAGADDYLTKPFSPRQLLARVRAVLRRAEESGKPATKSSTIEAGGVTLDVQRRRVKVGEAEMSLTALEFQLLFELILQAGQVLTYSYILDRVWGYKGNGDASLIKGHIRNLRKKLSTASSGRDHIETIQGTGYVFRA